MKGLKIIEEQGSLVEVPTSEVPDLQEKKDVPQKSNSELAAEAFNNILNFAGNIVEIKKMKVQGKLILEKMDKDKEMLLAQAQAYAEKKNADTKSVIDRMNLIRAMMQDYYAQSNQQITGEDFRIIITEIVNQMCKVENGN